MFDFISIGDSTIDAFHTLDDREISLDCQLDTEKCRLSLTYADKIPVKDFKIVHAGNASNAAVGIARLGFSSALVTMVGDDDRGKSIRQHHLDEGVAADFFVTDHENQTNYSTVLSYKGERTILVYHAPRRYRLPKFSKPKWLYLTSMAKGSEVIFPELTKLMKNDGVKLVYQPGTFQLRLGIKPTKELLTYTQLIIMNKEEAEMYLGLNEQAELPELADGLLALGPKIAVITDAKNGAVAAHGLEKWKIRSRPEIPRIEATGAGDAFSLAFTAALMNNQPIPEALRWGSMNAESVIGQIGPQAGLLDREMLEQHLHQAQDFQAEKL